MVFTAEGRELGDGELLSFLWSGIGQYELQRDWLAQFAEEISRDGIVAP